MWKRLITVVAVSACIVGATAVEASACSCLPPNLAQSYGWSSDVISARIVSKIEVGNVYLYRARVIAAYKGCYKRGQTVLLQTANNGAACGVNLEKGSVYLLNGDKGPGSLGKTVLKIGLCDYNVLWSSLSKAQRSWLKGRTVCCDDKCWCADGSQPVNCFVDPCEVTDCPMGDCTANYCGGCNAEFYSSDGVAWCNPCDGDDDCAWGQYCSADGQCLGACESDDDCPTDSWCSPTMEGGDECKPFQQEGDWCGGFTPVWAQSKCAPGLVCTDVPPFIADAPGTCRKPCESDDECGGGQYCSVGGYCRDMGACWEDKDCNLSGNQYPHIECVGSGVCSDNGQCGWECGGGGDMCADLADVSFGACEAIVGFGIVDGACTWISGCSANGYDLFDSMEACEEGCGCAVDGAFYAPGDGWGSSALCEECQCLPGGEIYCSKKPCPAYCEYKGELYLPGDSFPAGDGCNTCFCMEDGSIGCTKMFCGGCEYQGAWYESGESFPAGDGCNTCSCQDNGQVICTLMACIETCDYGGETYLPGDTFPSGDGCNECFCGDDGMVGCTKIGCIPDGCTVENQCDDNTFGMCWAPGQSLPCGACFMPEPWMGCDSDSDCGAGTVCDWDDSSCLCEPAMMCVSACTADSQCEEGESCTAGHCTATACAANSDCPVNFDCNAGVCKRQSCSSSSDCYAWCVNGQCWEAPGYCSPPPP